MLEKAGVSTGPKKKPSQTSDRKDIEVQTEPDMAYPITSLLHEENSETGNSEVRRARVSHEAKVHSEFRSRVIAQSKTNSSDLVENTNVVGHSEHSHFNSSPSPLPPGYKPSLPVISNHSPSTSQA